MTKKPGNRSLPILTKSVIHNEWLHNSIPSNDRRLGRNKVVMKKVNFLEVYDGIQIPEELLKEEFKRNVLLVTAEKHIATCSTKKIMKNIFSKFHIKVSKGSVQNYKPFFVGTTSEREKALCLCKLCLNLRYIFTALMNILKDEGKAYYDSISEYFMENSDCPKVPIGYWGYRCCKGTCPECRECSSPDLDVNNPEINVTYSQFVTKKVPYVVTRGPDNGKTKLTTRCDRENFKTKFNELKILLDPSRSSYILHRYYIQCEKYIFSDFRSSIPDYGCIYWVMSENLAFTPKDQCQDAHFNQRQSSLCCTVEMNGPNSKDNNYHYHLSDYNTHNISYTGEVFDDLYPMSTDMKIFRVKSDNCSEQFKSKYVFGFWEDFSKRNDIVLLFYGVSGHGKGLVDSMSSFGVKGPIRDDILLKDFWYQNSEDLKEHLSLRFFDDNTKNYYVLDPVDLVKRDEEKMNLERELNGCNQMMMMSFHPDGKILGARNYCSCDNCLVGTFDACDDNTCDAGIYNRKKGKFVKPGNREYNLIQECEYEEPEIDNEETGYLVSSLVQA